MSIRRHAKYPLFFSDFNKPYILQQDFEINQAFIFFLNLSIWSQVFHLGGRTDGQTNMPNPTVAFRKFAKAPKTSIQNQIDLHNVIIPNILCFQ
jgi:hypothetical protein